jgi:glutamate---cysteine ligase / carboxylate-amine ligase
VPPASDEADSEVVEEFYLQQIETSTPPCHGLDELDAAIRAARSAVLSAADAAGAAAVAMPVPVLEHPDEHVTPEPRYLRLHDDFGELAKQTLICGMHVHVDVADVDEAVGVVDRLRPWLPVLLALSANSPFWHGRDTGVASWRHQILGRWPTAGPHDVFGDAASYRRVTRELIELGASYDVAGLYFDARPSATFPTVEIRVADVCTEAGDAVLVAGLARALVETAAREHRDGAALAPWRTDLLRVSGWRAGRDGVSGRLVHPVQRTLAPVRDVFAATVEHAGPALDEWGDRATVEDAFERLLARGNGAQRQRAVFESSGDLAAVVRDLRERTERSVTASAAEAGPGPTAGA